MLFPTDSEAELQLLKDTCNKWVFDVASFPKVLGKRCCGGTELAEKLLANLDTKELIITL